MIGTSKLIGPSPAVTGSNGMSSCCRL